eukprot:GSMAST32.ASY1.ANO1.1708.1 assembled CDS
MYVLFFFTKKSNFFFVRNFVPNDVFFEIFFQNTCIGSSVILIQILSPKTLQFIPYIVKLKTQQLNTASISSSYGLFRSMTGVERPEIILEWSDDGNTWEEIHFRYKPGDPTQSPPWVAPYQPRLDWQMWFAALSNYVCFIFFFNKKIEFCFLRNYVLDLLDTKRNIKISPNFIRARLFTYDFSRYDTTWNKKVPEALLLPLPKLFFTSNPNSNTKKDESDTQTKSSNLVVLRQNWWTRKFKRIYMYFLFFFYKKIEFFFVRNFVPNDYFLKYFSKIHSTFRKE